MVILIKQTWLNSEHVAQSNVEIQNHNLLDFRTYGQSKSVKISDHFRDRDRIITNRAQIGHNLPGNRPGLFPEIGPLSF